MAFGFKTGTAANSGTRPVKEVSETARERETFKFVTQCPPTAPALLTISTRYNPSLSADSLFASDGHTFPSSDLATAGDSVLTALAQLGLYQTGAARGLISLFDASHQYIVAEADQSMPITPDLPSNDCPAPLSLCGTAIPRNQGACDHVLFLADRITNSGIPDATELPISFVPNLVADSRFNSRPYCQYGDAGMFYAGVPIRTRRGINIGAYCVMSPTTPDGWDEKCTRRLRDISHAIMEHLEFKRSKHIYRRSERMNRGLGSFIEGKGTLTGWQTGPDLDAFTDRARQEGSLNPKQQHIKLHQKQESIDEDELRLRAEEPAARTHGTTISWSNKLAEIPIANSPTNPAGGALRTSSSRSAGNTPQRVGVSGPTLSLSTGESGTNQVFSKAANVIREAFEVEGSFFFDVTLGSYRMPSAHSPLVNNDVAEASGKSPSASSSDEQNPPSLAEGSNALCDVLGFSTTETSSIDNTELVDSGPGRLPRHFLAKLLRRYPDGKIFNFDAVGELETSDSSGEDSTFDVQSHDSDPFSPLEAPDSDTQGKTRRRQDDRRSSRAKEGSLIHQAFPSARSVAFIPVWDLRRERWVAGGFIYTLTPTRVFSGEGELSFLKAFARLIATELLNLETARAHKAKSDALGSLSHELRSPLHGIILGTELLADTDLSVFQGNATHTIETCCRTLLDTIDHLLDFSKVNSFATKRKQGSRGNRFNLRERARSDQFGKMMLYSDTRLDALLEEVAESVFAGFNFQHVSIRQLSKQNKREAEFEGYKRLDLVQAMEQLGPDFDGHGVHRLQIENVSVFLSIDPTCNWVFHMHPGAIRRIIMNLFGNSLKYTANGTIRISITQEAPQTSRRSKTERVVKLTVQDTGKGISEEFLRHRLFKPFSQEDELASGTGLGLSLVKTITSQLRGQISVESQVGVGTTITVKLPLEQAPQTSNTPLERTDDDKVFEEQLRELKGLRVRVSGFDSPGTHEGRAYAEDICRRWLHMNIVSDGETMPDIVLWSDDALPDSPGLTAQQTKSPNVVICRNSLISYERFSKYEKTGQSDVFDFITQPYVA